MHIGIVSHVSTNQLAPYLNLTGSEPSGTAGATAPNLLIIELLKLGYKVSVFALTTSLKEGQSKIVYGHNLTIYYGGYRNKIRSSALSFFRLERNFLTEIIKKISPDVLHAHWQYEYSWAALATGIPTLVTCRDSPIKVLLLHKNLYRFIRLIIACIVLKKAKNISATSSYLKDEIEKLGFKKNISVIPNFEPSWLFEITAEQNKDLSKPLVIMINNGFDKRKNVAAGIAAFHLFRQKRPLAQLHLFGKGYEEHGEAFEWSKKNQMLEGLHFRGYMEFVELMNVLPKYTLLLHPSIEETFGNTLTEAMAVGVPVIGGKASGSVPWLIGNQSKGGILTDISSPREMANAMESLLKNKQVYNNFSENAKFEAKNRFSSEIVVEEYVQTYESIKLTHCK